MSRNRLPILLTLVLGGALLAPAARASLGDAGDVQVVRTPTGASGDLTPLDPWELRDLVRRFGVALHQIGPDARTANEVPRVVAWETFVDDAPEDYLEELQPAFGDLERFGRLVLRLEELAVAIRDAGVPVTQAISGTLDDPSLPLYSSACGLAQQNEDILEAIRDAVDAGEQAAIIAQAVCDTLVVVAGEGTNAATCLAARSIQETNRLARKVLDRIEACNRDILQVEARATFENSETAVEALKCIPVSQLLKGHGCDGADNDCDAVIDDCDEDRIGPEVFFEAALHGRCFRTFAEALAASDAAFRVSDDCRSIVDRSVAVTGVSCDVIVLGQAVDGCFRTGNAQSLVVIDGDGPTIVLDPALEGSCFPSIAAAEAAVRAGATIGDLCTTAGEIAVSVHSSVTPCGLRIKLEAVDRCGNASDAAVTVRVDTARPQVEIERLLLGFRGEVLGFQTPACYGSVGEAEAAVAAASRATDDCTATETLARTVTSSGDPCSMLVTSRAQDECTNANTDAVTVRVDDIAPAVTVAVERDELSPPNHEMVDVGLSFGATDNCPGDPRVEVLVTSDEPTSAADGAGQTTPSPDAELLRELDGRVVGLRLRAERSSEGDGRVYRIVVRATDPCGHAGEAAAFVSVPPSSSRSAVDSGQFHDATAIN